LPPPTSATDEALWCGARVTRCRQRRGSNPAPTLCTAADSSACASVSGGSRPAKRCASIDLPLPGGPTIKMVFSQDLRYRLSALPSLRQ